MFRQFTCTRIPLKFSLPTSSSGFHISAINYSKARIYNSIRNEADFHTILRLSTTAGIPLITFWTTSYCPSCRTIKPIINEIIERRGEEGGAVGFAEVELDAPGGGMGELGYRYLIRSIPTLLPFNRSETVDDKRLIDTRLMTDREKLHRWVEEVANGSGENRISGKGWLSGLFGG